MTQPALLDSLERIAFSAVAITTIALQEVAGAELTFLGWRVLVILGDGSTPIRMGDLAVRLALSRPSASKLMRRLQRRGLVELVHGESDRRVVLAALTPAGVQLRGAVVARRRAIFAEALAMPLPRVTDRALDAISERLDRWR